MIFFFLICSERISGQNLPAETKGQVSYISSTNIYVKFSSTESIQIGDTFTEGEELKFTGIPHFAPELFRLIRLKDPLKTKQLQKGLQQLSEEGSTQVFFPTSNNDIVVGAVGVLGGLIGVPWGTMGVP